MKRLIYCLLIFAVSYTASADDLVDENVVFSIGVVDRSSSEFIRTSYGNIRFVTIDAEGETNPKLLPKRLIHPDGDYSPKRTDAAQEVIINFQLIHEAERLILRIARSGDSITAVTIDDTDTYHVTHTMLGSNEGGIFGSYDLNIGPQNTGHHSITLNIPEDGLGNNGSYSWDAIALYRE